MIRKTFTEMTDVELWFDFHAAQIAARPAISKTGEDRLLDALFGDAWCCNAARKFKRIQSKASPGISMSCNFCPGCGKPLEK